MAFITKRSTIVKMMFIFPMVMNCGNTSANITDVTSNTKVDDGMGIAKMTTSNRHLNLVYFRPSSTVL